ncbi:hypothetical protein J2P76_20190 [Bordetella petrii]|nr:hypothetical protein [Bordetella petrii]
MAEPGSWPSIRERGLLSTTASLDQSIVTTDLRTQIESARRPQKVVVNLRDGTNLVLRDQKPMSDARLTSCLLDGITPKEWYEFINRKTFFWATQTRLITLLEAYAESEHDILIVDTASLVAAHEARISLCHMNSGNTTPWAHPRNYEVFKTIASYPATPRGRPHKEVAEVVVDYAVPDIHCHVTAVCRMRGARVTSKMPYD